MLDWFCERYQCWMSKDSCDRRRLLASGSVRFGPQNRMGATVKKIRDAGCAECHQNTTITRNAEEIVTEQPERTCTTCGKTFPLERFYFSSTTKRHDTKCKTCRGEVQKKQKLDAAQAKKTQQTCNTKPAPAAPATVSAGKEPGARMEIVVSFARHPELYRELVERADAEFRDAAMQIMYYIHSAIGGDREKTA